MKLTELSIENFRSIASIKAARISPTQILLGENNAGKSNILYAIDAFLSAGSGGIIESDFQDKAKPIVLAVKFIVTSPALKKVWKPYMRNNELYLEKRFELEEDERTKKKSVKGEFHGYQAEPANWFLSIKKINERSSGKPKWKEIVSQNNLPGYFLKDGGCTKADFEKGLARYIQENEVLFDDPDLSATQALGFQSKVVSNLPKYYLLRAESNYSDETDKRSSTSTFRKLMADLTDRIIKHDPRYIKVQVALQTVNDLLNKTHGGDAESLRLESLSAIEDRIKELLCKLMPSVEKIKLKVVTEDVSTIFSKGVEIAVNDGFETDVLLKGHGLQRCTIFSLLHALILNERDELVPLGNGVTMEKHPIILAIEEPELYIHPQLGKLFYDVLNSFAKTDQVLYTTHSPRFIDVYEYESIALIKKTKTDGTKLLNCDPTAFSGLNDKKVFQGLTQLNSDVNELFFAKRVIVVEGPEDKVAITETAKKLQKVKVRVEEMDVTVIVAGGKPSIPFFVRILNAFKMNYSVLHDLDIEAGMKTEVKDIEEKRNQAIADLAPNKVVTFPVKLESTLGLGKGHLKDQYDSLNFFSVHSNINTALEVEVLKALRLVGVN